MKKITLLWCFLIAFSPLLNAQHLTSSEELELLKHANSPNSIENLCSIDVALLAAKHQALGNQIDDINLHFTDAEIKALRTYYRFQNRDVMADWIPNAGATQTFSPEVGDFFFDPGGPGGSSTGGDAGNYPNCGCVTTTTLDGVTEIEFLFFSVFATFDWLRIYDGVDTSGTVLYDNGSGGTNSGDITLADMISSNGSAVFTGTSGALTFEFNASTVVDYGGWEVEILAVGSGGGGGGDLVPTAYGINNATPSYGYFEIDNPAVFNNISAGSNTPNFEGAGAIDPNDNDTAYVIDNFGAMWSVDVQTGVYTSLGNIGVLDMTGLEFNPVDGELYATTTTAFYSIDIDAVSATLIGSLNTPGNLAIALAIDAAGNAYTYDVADDILYSINTATGSTTVIGNIGFDANFGQGMAYDAETDQVYMAAFNNTLFDTELRLVDTNTGNTTALGTIIPGTLSQFGWISIINAESGGSQEGNLWEVNVSSTGWGDETTWELRDADGIVLLSGGPYGNAYNDTQSVNTDNEPLEFYIETMGTLGDNTASYTVSCSGEVVVSGVVNQDSEVTESGLECAGSGGGDNNWECADAIALECGDTSSGTTAGATNSGGNASPDVFYSYTGNGEVEFITVSLCGSGYDTYLRVFESCDNLTIGNEVAFNDDFCGVQSELTFESDGTTTYIILVEGFSTSSGTYTLELTCEFPPAPPACGGIFTDTGGETGNYSNSEDVTWTITPDEDFYAVTVVFNSFDVEANWDALYVYDGPDVNSPLISSGNPATASGFPAGGYYGTTIPGPFTSTHESGALTFRFRSDGSVNRAGWVADIMCDPVPPFNDLIENAYDAGAVDQPYVDADARTHHATVELLNPVGCAIAGAPGVWYKFTAVEDGMATAQIGSPEGVTVAIFFSADSMDVDDETDLTYVESATNPCGSGSETSIETMAGQSYYVYVVNTGGMTDVTIDITTLGVNENEIDGFSFYPNPAGDIINLTSNNSIENVVIYSITGQVVSEKQIQATTSQMDVSSLATGVYLLKVTSNGQVGTYRMIKE